MKKQIWSLLSIVFIIPSAVSCNHDGTKVIEGYDKITKYPEIITYINNKLQGFSKIIQFIKASALEKLLTALVKDHKALLDKWINEKDETTKANALEKLLTALTPKTNAAKKVLLNEWIGKTDETTKANALKALLTALTTDQDKKVLLNEWIDERKTTLKTLLTALTPETNAAKKTLLKAWIDAKNETTKANALEKLLTALTPKNEIWFQKILLQSDKQQFFITYNINGLKIQYTFDIKYLQDETTKASALKALLAALTKDKEVLKTDKEVLKTDKEVLKTDKEVLKTDKEVLKTDKEVLKTDKEVLLKAWIDAKDETTKASALKALLAALTTDQDKEVLLNKWMNGTFQSMRVTKVEQIT